MNETDTLEAETENDRARAEEREENARKAREEADRLFPGHRWRKVEDGIYLSPRRPIGKKSNYKVELENARILRDTGSTVYLAPEQTDVEGKKQHDAIVNGLVFEFKNVGGNANTLITHFLRSRSQAPNVFFNLETSSLTKPEVISTLYGARNRKAHVNRKGKTIGGYADCNKYAGGMVILKLQGEDGLVFLDVDGFELPG